MKNSNLFLKNKIRTNFVSRKSLNLISKKFEKIYLETQNDIEDASKTLNVLSGKFNFNFKIKNLKKFKKFKKIALIGMGGSILGAEAIYNFLQTKIKKKVYFFNNLDEKKIIDFKKREDPSNVLFIIISKSGNTLETLSNIFLLNILKKNAKNIIIISEKKNNSLFLLSKKLDLFFIEHKKNIGGRYSVLSEVGILPAYLMGLNIFKIRSKIKDSLSKKINLLPRKAR